MSPPGGATPIKRSFPFPIPNGWFMVAYSDELRAGDVVPIHYFGQDLVLFRTEDGQAHVLDAHCPHLGAHLGYGGKVRGQALVCPFHAWEWSGDGACLGIPYAKKIPPKARIRSWTLVEKNGMLLVWRHAKGEPPGWEIPDIPEIGSDAWNPPVRREWTVRSRNQELAENTVDPAHFRYVHGTQTLADTEFDTEGPILRVVSKAVVGTPRGEAQGRIEITAYGFGFGMTRFTGVVETLVITSGAPIDDEHVHMRLAFIVRKLSDQSATRGVGKAFVAEIERQFRQDIRIWENKIHLPRPALCDGDGPIGLLRKWAQQFYTFDPS